MFTSTPNLSDEISTFDDHLQYTPKRYPAIKRGNRKIPLHMISMEVQFTAKIIGEFLQPRLWVKPLVVIFMSTLDESTVNPKGIFSWIVPFKYQILTRGEYPPNKSMVFICIHGVVSPLTPLKTTGWDDGSLHQPEPPDITARGGGVETGASRQLRRPAPRER